MRRLVVLAVATVLILSFAWPAYAGDFSPTTTYSFSRYNKSANPSVKYALSQDKGEETLKKAVLYFPAGYVFPRDAQMKDGELIGTGHIKIQVGPGCAGGQGTFPFETDATLKEKDRTDKQKSQGIRDVWELEIPHVTTVDITIKGSPATGYVVTAPVPPNDFTCPPFTFSLSVNKTS